MRAPPRRVRPASIALALALSLWACSDGDTANLPGDAAAGAPSAAASPSASPFIEIPTEARRADLPPLDPDATPRTELGELRARYLPLWTQDFDLAFPPHVCGTAWELDAIAVPVTGVNVSHYGDPATMAALAVMRYEHLLASAFAKPTRLAQLCLAVAAVDPARTEALAAFAPAIGTAGDEPGEMTIAQLREHLADADAPAAPSLVTPPKASDPSSVPEADTEGEPAPATPTRAPQEAPSTLGLYAMPNEVTIMAVSPSSMLAVACLDQTIPLPATPVAPQAGTADHEAPPPAGEISPARLKAYALELSRGVEDRVADISYRVARVDIEHAEGCSSLPNWTAAWRLQVQQWNNQGQHWLPFEIVRSIEDICHGALLHSSHDCPDDWPLVGQTTS